MADPEDVLERVAEGSPEAVALGWRESVLPALPLVFPSKDTLGGCVAVMPSAPVAVASSKGVPDTVAEGRREEAGEEEMVLSRWGDGVAVPALAVRVRGGDGVGEALPLPPPYPGLTLSTALEDGIELTVGPPVRDCREVRVEVDRGELLPAPAPAALAVPPCRERVENGVTVAPRGVEVMSGEAEGVEVPLALPVAVALPVTVEEMLGEEEIDRRALPLPQPPLAELAEERVGKGEKLRSTVPEDETVPAPVTVKAVVAVPPRATLPVPLLLPLTHPVPVREA